MIIPSRGSSGGLALFWKNELQVNVIKYSMSNIDVEINSGDGFGWWHFTSFYGNPDSSSRDESWSCLKYLSGISQLPWLVIGDFNELTGLSKKEGGATRPAQQMQRFVDTLNWCGLHDKFTWLYQQADGTQIRERLARAGATCDWCIKFPQAKLFNKTSSVSDHNPLLLQLFSRTQRKKHGKIFRFEAIWLKEASYEEVVSSS